MLMDTKGKNSSVTRINILGQAFLVGVSASQKLISKGTKEFRLEG